MKLPKKALYPFCITIIVVICTSPESLCQSRTANNPVNKLIELFQINPSSFITDKITYEEFTLNDNRLASILNADLPYQKYTFIRKNKNNKDTISIYYLDNNIKAIKLYCSEKRAKEFIKNNLGNRNNSITIKQKNLLIEDIKKLSYNDYVFLFVKYIDPDSKYEILVFNNNILNEDIRNIRIKEEENFLESVHKIDSFKYNLNLGDSLVTAHNYKQGIIVYKSITNSEKRVLIQERIKKALSQKCLYELDSAQRSLASGDYAHAAHILRNMSDCEEFVSLMNSLKKSIDKASLNNDIETKLKIARVYFANQEYQKAKDYYTLVLSLDPNADVKDMIELCDKNICSAYENQAENMFIEHNYDSAVFYYEIALNCVLSNISLSSESLRLEKKIIQSKELPFLIKAQEQKNINNLLGAISHLRLALKINPNNTKTQTEIQELEEQHQYQMKRTIQHVYALENPTSFNQLGLKLNHTINSAMNSASSGYWAMHYLIDFDTNGVQKSKFLLNNSEPDYISRKYSSLWIKDNSLEPTRFKSYFISSQSSIKSNIAWETFTAKYLNSPQSGIKEIRPSSQNEIPYSVESKIKAQIIALGNIPGNYNFEIKEKKVRLETNSTNTQNLYYDVTFENHSIRGPAQSIFSLIPGMGSYRVSYGTNGGKKRLISFTVFAGIYGGSYLYQQHQYSRYLESVSLNDRNQLYKHADIANKVALVSGTIASCILTYDLLYTFQRGIKNKIMSRSIHQRMRKSKYVIQYQEVAP